MKWKRNRDGSTNDTFVLSSGREVYAYGQTIGLGPGDVDNVAYGCDGGFGVTDWTPEERRELAVEMVRLWCRFGGLDEPDGW